MTPIDNAIVRVTALRAWTHSGPCLVTGAATLAPDGTPVLCAPDANVGSVFVGEQHKFSQVSRGRPMSAWLVVQSRLSSDADYQVSAFPVADLAYPSILDRSPRECRFVSTAC